MKAFYICVFFLSLALMTTACFAQNEKCTPEERDFFGGTTYEEKANSYKTLMNAASGLNSLEEARKFDCFSLLNREYSILALFGSEANQLKGVHPPKTKKERADFVRFVHTWNTTFTNKLATHANNGDYSKLRPDFEIAIDTLKFDFGGDVTSNFYEFLNIHSIRLKIIALEDGTVRPAFGMLMESLQLNSQEVAQNAFIFPYYADLIDELALVIGRAPAAK